MQSNTIEIPAFTRKLSQHIYAVNNFNNFAREWLRGNTAKNSKMVDDTSTPNRTLTTVMATKELSVQHMSHLKNLLIIMNSLTGNKHDALANQERQNHQKTLTITKQLSNLTVALEGLLKVVGAA